MYDYIDIATYTFGVLLISAGIGCTIGGSICLFVNKNNSQECYIAFAVGVSIIICVLGISLFLWGLHKLESTSSSGPILPLSSSPSAASKSQKTHKKPLTQAQPADRPRSLTQ